MNSTAYQIKKVDKRIKHISKIRNYIIESCSSLNWYYSINIENNDNLEIELEKQFEYEKVSFRINVIIILNNKVNISIDNTNFHNYGIENFMLLFLSKFDDEIYESVSNNRKNKIDNNMNAENILNKIFETFHRSSKQLLKRHDKKETIIIKDEYDVQDYLHSLLLLFFDDVRDEDPLPKKAGASSREDFFLPKEGIIIETKISSDNNKDKEIGEQIIIDIKRYTANKDVKKIYFFVYNPNYKIKNPTGLENDLSNDKNVEVIVKVFPK